MRAIVLGRSIEVGLPRYRGTYREHPFHFDLPEDHEANRAFQLFSRLSDESGVIGDLDAAASILDSYRRYAPERNFELVEVTTVSERPVAGREIIGFDISCGFYYSLVAAVIAFERSQDTRPGYVPGVSILDHLLRAYFIRMLNAHALFDSSDVAQDCLDAMMALQRSQPNLYENPDMRFEVVGIHRAARAGP